MANEKIRTRPWCPFCGQKVGKAIDSPARKMHEFAIGDCQCGAVYTCDPTGHNVGAAMVETLVYACGGNADYAWELLPEDDYLTGRIENYDEQHHQVFDSGNVDGRSVRGVLFFVRLHGDLPGGVKESGAESKAGTVQSQVESKPRYNHPIEPVPDEKRVRQKATKKHVKELVSKGDIDGLVSLCFDDKKTLRLMQRLLYDPVDANRWYVAWAIGQVCARVSTLEPGQVSQLLHRLYEACSDSAATPWGMIETIGSIISNRPDIFGAFARHLLNYLNDPSTCNQVLWALSEIAEHRPDLIRDLPFYNLFRFLEDPDASNRGNTVKLLGRIKATEVVSQLVELQNDTTEFTFCADGELILSTVAEEAERAIRAISGGSSNE